MKKSIFKPVIFVGPTMSQSDIFNIFPDAIIKAPIQRGELYNEFNLGNRLFLIIDGIFASELAVSPREIIDVIHNGAIVVGSSSMGALRASECYPIGMHGIGLIYRCYKLGLFESDDEVAVLMNPLKGYESITYPHINILYALKKAFRDSLITKREYLDILKVSKNKSFKNRFLFDIFKESSLHPSKYNRLEKVCKEYDLKKIDAFKSLLYIKKFQKEIFVTKDNNEAIKLKSKPRYLGHDKFLGKEKVILQEELLIWLFGSGRYQKYIWPIISYEVKFNDVNEKDVSLRPELIRDKLEIILNSLLSNRREASQKIWYELEYMDELEAEIMRMYAIKELSKDINVEQSDIFYNYTKEEIAITHGLDDWGMLQEYIENKKLFNAIPIEWIKESINLISKSRYFSFKN